MARMLARLPKGEDPPSILQSSVAGDERVRDSKGSTLDTRDAQFSDALRDVFRVERAGALRVGHSLGRFVVVEQIGRGGMGVVYRAYDAQLDRLVAIKTVARRGR